MNQNHFNREKGQNQNCIVKKVIFLICHQKAIKIEFQYSNFMPPKKASTRDNISISSTNSRVRSNIAADLITKSQAALSSQASIYTQRTQGSQDANPNYGMAQNQYIQFNREDISEVFITKDEEQVIQKILELARKGKVNSKNAFEIPIKVVHTESVSSINNKFWKFASELLDASMFIYDKRVQNMFISIGAFENKLSRIGFNIKNKGEGQNQEKFDDINTEQEHKRNKNREERHQMLRISVDDFSGSLNLNDEGIIGFESIEKKDKLDIKNMENKFIADPTFERTQKLFDSFSLKSLMLNIFGLSTDLNVGLFHKSDLDSDKANRIKQMANSKDQTQINTSQNNLDKAREVDENSRSEGNIIEFQQQHGQMTTKSEIKMETSSILKHTFNLSFGNDSLPSNLEKHLQTSRALIREKPMLTEVTDFISKQPELRQDYFERNANAKKEWKNSGSQFQDQPDVKEKNVTYGQIIEKERIHFVELFKEFYQSFDQDLGGHQFSQIKNGEGLFQTHETQSQQFEQADSSHFYPSFNNQSVHSYHQTNSMPVSLQDSFFTWDQQNNIIQPIMPWEIEFKNLKLTKKRKKVEKGQSKNSKKSKQSAAQSIVDFGLQIVDRKQILVQKDVKKKFENQNFRTKFKQNNCQPKEFDIAHSEYHLKFASQPRNTQINNKPQNYRDFTQPEQLALDINQPSFVFDFDQSVFPDPGNKQKQEELDNADEETRFIDADNFQNHSDQGNFFDVSKNSVYVGAQMGVNNIREIKKLIVSEVNEKGKTSLDYMNRMLVNLSPQQMFTIFLHLTNEHQFEISNEDGDQSTIVLSIAHNQYQDEEEKRGFDRKNQREAQQVQI